jgi:hypothetical protein
LVTRNIVTQTLIYLTNSLPVLPHALARELVVVGPFLLLLKIQHAHDLIGGKAGSAEQGYGDHEAPPRAKEGAGNPVGAEKGSYPLSRHWSYIPAFMTGARR